MHTSVERNMALATAVDREEFQHHLSAYHDRLETAVETWRQLREDDEMVATVTGDPYWRWLSSLMRTHDRVLPGLIRERTETEKLLTAF